MIAYGIVIFVPVFCESNASFLLIVVHEWGDNKTGVAKTLLCRTQNNDNS